MISASIKHRYFEFQSRPILILIFYFKKKIFFELELFFKFLKLIRILYVCPNVFHQLNYRFENRFYLAFTS